MIDDKYIKKAGFNLFLRRELSLLATSIIIISYTDGLKSIIGFSFKYICYLKNGSITDSLRVEKDLVEYNNVVQKIIKNNRLKTNQLLDKGLKLNDEVVKIFNTKKDYQKYTKTNLYKELKKLFVIYKDLFLFSTVIPYEIGRSLNVLIEKNKIKNYSRLEDKVNKLRVVSLYTVFEKKALSKLFQEIARRKNIADYTLLFNLEYSEMLEFVKSNTILTEKKLIHRKKYVNLLTPRVRFVKFGRINYKKYHKLFFPENNKKIIVNLSGTTSYPGIVRGNIKVILKKDDVSRFKKGEILVTISSNPVLMPAIRKAGAIVSDEGGVTCHASIISRELKIPCIVGTKQATSLLKNGDLVEVDANRGIIKML